MNDEVVMPCFSQEEKQKAFVTIEEVRKRRNPDKHKDIALFNNEVDQ